MIEESRRSRLPRFSLSSLLVATAVIAIGMAVNSAYRKNRAMVRQRAELLALSSRLQVNDTDKLASSQIPKVANDFTSWNVHVPDGQEYVLHLGIGDVSENGVPPTVDQVTIPSGQHRVTFHSSDSPQEGFRYIAYVNGELAIEKTMGSEWMPTGWSSSRGLNWPREPGRPPAPLQLMARSYKPKRRFGDGPGRYFNGQSDAFVTRKGYRLWIDTAGRSYQPASPFVGFSAGGGYQGVGLRDGLRLRPNGRSVYEWAITRPSLETDAPMLRISAEFSTEDGAALSNQTSPFDLWRLSGDAREVNRLDQEDGPAQSSRSAFLHAQHQAADSPQPVVEMKWDTDRPDEVALRLADTPANDRIRRWRLRILDGDMHLWRRLRIGEQTIDADEAAATEKTTPTTRELALDREGAAVSWRTNETLPLQIAERTQPGYAGMGFYQGLPAIFGLQIPAGMDANLSLKHRDAAPDGSENGFPGGAIFDEIEFDLDATARDWIWLQVKPME